MSIATQQTLGRKWFGSRVAAGALAGALALTIGLGGDSPEPVAAAPLDEARFVSMSPCRLIDTREASRVGPFDRWGVAETNTVQAIGSNGDCTIPNDATGLSMNVTALSASALSFLTFWPEGNRPLAASLNPSPDQPPVPNAVTTRLGDDGAFRVYNETGTTHVVIDVNGYYSRSGVSDLEAQLAALTTRLATLEAQANATDLRVDAIDAREAFVVSAVETSDVDVSSTTTALSVDIIAPAVGRVLASSTASIFDFNPNGITSCSLTTGTVVDNAYDQGFESGNGSARLSQIAGFRVFDVSAGEELGINLVCSHIGVNSALLTDVVMTATFLPG